MRDLATTLLFLVVFLKSHSEELREAEGRKKGGGLDKCWTKHLLVREDVSGDVNALFVALADIFHCWFSSPVSVVPCEAKCFRKCKTLCSMHNINFGNTMYHIMCCL